MEMIMVDLLNQEVRSQKSGAEDIGICVFIRTNRLAQRLLTSALDFFRRNKKAHSLSSGLAFGTFSFSKPAPL
jgi:hypothetical protein